MDAREIIDIKIKINVMDEARAYKRNGYTHVCAHIEDTKIWRGFKSRKEMLKWIDGLQYGVEYSYSFMTVNKAIKLGY